MSALILLASLALSSHGYQPPRIVPGPPPKYDLPLYPPTTAPITVPLILDRFTEFDKNLMSMTCQFTQSARWQEAGTPQAVEGMLEYKKPELIHIEQKTPEPQTTVSDGQWLWVYRKSTDQVIQTKLVDWKRSEPLAQGLLDFGNYADMLRKYDVAITTIGAPDPEGYRRVELALRPREKAKAGEFELALKLSTRDFFPNVTVLSVGQVEVRSTFKNIKYNPPIKDERFRFKPPEGADVFQNFKPPKPE